MRVWSAGFRVQGSGFRVFGVWKLEKFRVWSFGFSV